MEGGRSKNKDEEKYSYKEKIERVSAFLCNSKGSQPQMLVF